ncbi:hypothetical protein F4806DRAFT_484856 [Annulohypoxylon nitens]|nr:hypothetical protein F4806DRAFT_484856 [Annulohypoxylon nitens]
MVGIPYKVWMYNVQSSYVSTAFVSSSRIFRDGRLCMCAVCSVVVVYMYWGGRVWYFAILVVVLSAMSCVFMSHLVGRPCDLVEGKDTKRLGLIL